jgi:hypothetical protein
MKITRVQAIQAHPVPKRVYEPRGPFPEHIFDEPEIVDEYQVEQDENGTEYDLGATAQNNYRPVKHYRCKSCDAKVTAIQLDSHVCEE